MAVPARRVSRTARDKRRTHDNLKAPTLVECPNCKEMIKPHTLCKHCGYYDGRKVK
ncbi:MAG: 50S ribosomal protein L32 [Erysipelotrichaceae bacterium]|nr:50S ribosomal protein L32 [Erysipelotrichaceae bacterium]